MNQVLLKIEISLPEKNSSIEFQKEITINFIPDRNSPGILFRVDQTEIVLDSKSFIGSSFDYFNNRFEVSHRFEFVFGIGDPDGMADYCRRLLFMFKSEGFTYEDEYEYQTFIAIISNFN